MSWDFLDRVSQNLAKTQNGDWDHQKIDDDYSLDSVAFEITQPHPSLRQLMDQVNSNWQTPEIGLIRAAETNDSEIDSKDITDLEAISFNENE